MDKIVKSDAEWRGQLTPEEFRVARQGGTEPAFSGRYWNCHDKGTYRCACCGTPLFSSEAKFDSGTGWPSFSAPLQADELETRDDLGHGMRRTEVRCRRCEAHLGHLFPDGPGPTGLRYCMNSTALRLAPE